MVSFDIRGLKQPKKINMWSSPEKGYTGCGHDQREGRVDQVIRAQQMGFTAVQIIPYLVPCEHTIPQCEGYNAQHKLVAPQPATVNSTMRH